MESCIAKKSTAGMWLAWIASGLLGFFNHFNLSMTRAADRPIVETVEREVVNQQAARMLDEHGNRILRLAYSYLHNMSDAEEVLQDTLIQFLKTVPTFQSKEHERAWLLRVAANLSKNRLEYNAIRKTDELEETLIAEPREDLSFVWEAVKELAPQYREAIHLFYYEGYTTAQIAALLKKKETTVRSNLHRGREKLKKILKEVYDFD